MAQRQRTTTRRGSKELEVLELDQELAVDEGNGTERRGLWDLVEERPLVVGAVTLALGLVAGLAVPGTRREDELLGETRDRLLEQARQKGREAIDRGKEMAQGAVAVATEGLAAAAPARRGRSTSRRRTTAPAAD